MKPRSPFTIADTSPPPISTLNTTPLIDVMLVLLIMFIVTVPAATHKVRIDLPSAGPTQPEMPQVHELALDEAGGLRWDGGAIPERALPARLAAMLAREPDALLRLRADGRTRYEAFDRVLAAVKHAGVERLAFVGNEAFSQALG